jgi:hypothetical protein
MSLRARTSPIALCRSHPSPCGIDFFGDFARHELTDRLTPIFPPGGDCLRAQLRYHLFHLEEKHSVRQLCLYALAPKCLPPFFVLRQLTAPSLKKLGSLARLEAALQRIAALGLVPVLGDGTATDISCWMEAGVARTTIGNAGENNGFLKLTTPQLKTPLPFPHATTRLPAG